MHHNNNKTDYDLNHEDSNNNENIKNKSKNEWIDIKINKKG